MLRKRKRLYKIPTFHLISRDKRNLPLFQDQQARAKEKARLVEFKLLMAALPMAPCPSRKNLAKRKRNTRGLKSKQ